MCGYDEFIDVIFMLGEERVNLRSVEEFGALGLWEDEVGEDEETDVGIKREPMRYQRLRMGAGSR